MRTTSWSQDPKASAAATLAAALVKEGDVLERSLLMPGRAMPSRDQWIVTTASHYPKFIGPMNAPYCASRYLPRVPGSSPAAIAAGQVDPSVLMKTVVTFEDLQAVAVVVDLTACSGFPIGEQQPWCLAL